jgi:hypothetical protein
MRGEQNELEAIGNLIDAILDGNASHLVRILVGEGGGCLLFRRFVVAWQGKAIGKLRDLLSGQAF